MIYTTIYICLFSYSFARNLGVKPVRTPPTRLKVNASFGPGHVIEIVSKEADRRKDRQIGFTLGEAGEDGAH